jgi:glycine cleavage system protein P-like pyridoxal-binding family
MGPIGVGEHLAPYLASSVVVPQDGLDAYKQCHQRDTLW